MSRPQSLLIAAAAIVVVAAVAYFFWGASPKPDSASDTPVPAEALAHSVDCTVAERQLAAAKAGHPEAGADTETVLRIVVWGCRGKPHHPLPAEL